MHLTEIGHLPGISGRESHYLVGHLVEIAVDRYRKIVHGLTERPAPRHSEIIFIGPLRTQRPVAETVIIQVIERRSVECRLVHASHKQHLLLPRLHAHRQTRRQPLYILGSRTLPDSLGDVSPHHRTCGRQRPPAPPSRESGQRSIAGRKWTRAHRAAESIYCPVLRESQRQTRHRAILGRGRQVILVLSVHGLIHSAGKLRSILPVAVPAIVIFAKNLQLPSGRELAAVSRLHKSVLVPKRFVRHRIVERHCSRQSAFGVEIITLYLQVTPSGHIVIHIGFAMPRIYGRVVASLPCDIFAVYKCEGIIAVGTHEIDVKRSPHTASGLLPPPCHRVDIPE